MPVDFLSDSEAAKYGRYDGPPSRAEMEKIFFLDNEDMALIKGHRGRHIRCGFALQLVTVRYLGCFLADPLEVPNEVLDVVAGQLQIEDPSCVKRYTERDKTRLEHTWEIAKAFGLKDFASAEVELAGKVRAHAWNTGDGPTACFQYAVRWLRQNDVLLPGISTLTRLVARERERATRQLHDTLAALPSAQQRAVLDLLLEVPPGKKVSDLERWRSGPSKASGPQIVKSLDLVAEIGGTELGRLELDAAVPQRRLDELARYGLTAHSSQLKKHPASRRLATLLATAQRLETKTIDDTLELLDLLMVTELLGKAQREADKQKVVKHPRLAKASAWLAQAVEVLLEAEGWSEDVRLFEVWEMIDAVVPRAQLRSAVATVIGLVPPPDAEDDGGWRAEMARKYATVSGFVKLLTPVIAFEANAEGARVLAAMKALPDALAYRSRHHPVTVLPVRLIDPLVVTGPWKRLVFGHPARTDGLIDRNAYVFCVLEQFHRHLKRREIHAPASSRWRDPDAQLLKGAAWTAVKDSVLTDLGLPEDPAELLAEHAERLDRAYRVVRAGLAANTSVTIDDDGKIHVASVKAIEEPPSLIDLRKRVEAMMPRVDISEAVVEVLGWCPKFMEAFTSIAGTGPHLDNLDISVAACLTAQALNITYGPIAVKGVPVLERHRLGYVDHIYLRADNYGAANPHLIAKQAGIGFAQALGGGLVAAIDGMRFVVPVPSAYARPNKKYFGPKRGITWLNMINDQAFGIASKIVSGTDRDCLHALDVIFGSGEGRRADVIVTDTGSYSDLVFGLAHLLDKEYRPALADLPDQKLWRVQADADYGALNALARGRLDLGKVIRWWPDILRLVGSIYTSGVNPYDVVRMLQRDGRPTAMGEAINTYGRIFKSLHVLALIDDEGMRRGIKGIRNLQEGRHDLAQKVFHGRKSQVFQRYYEGMEDQLGALGIVLNCLVLWNTVYIDDALRQLRAQGYPVLDDDVARLSPFVRRHINVHGRYSFQRPQLGGGRRALRDPDADDADDED
ncbi:Tn3 family transposase [Nonomuraea sp. NPDC050202]|uniref:Tn3 family transposase n=1 Tax=Nonomuraea sp. NPDC050202 TaxID=3155035 RepID=UPI0034112678